MAAEAVSGSDEILVGSIKPVNEIRCIDRYVRGTTSELSTIRRDLSSQTDDIRLFRFHAHLADYAGALCKPFKKSTQKSLIKSQPWTIIVKAIDKDQADLVAWTTSD